MKPLILSRRFLREAGFNRVKHRYGDSFGWIRGTASILAAKPTAKDVIEAVYQDGNAAGYAKAQADLRAAAQAFLGPLGLLPDARAQQMTQIPTSDSSWSAAKRA